MTSPPPQSLTSDTLDTDRLWRRIMRLAEIGATRRGGVNRPSLSPEDIAARRLICDWGRDIGLTASNDAVGNLYLRLEGERSGAEPVLCGSYLDTQPDGGKFSGAFGMLAAIEAAAAIVRAGRRPKVPIVLATWMNGEGARFSPGCMGSAAFTGRMQVEELMRVEDEHGTSVAAALESLYASEAHLYRRPLGFACRAYVELQLEQGRVLEQSASTIGFVTEMTGTRRFRIHVIGEAGHAGSSSRKGRKDALLAAVRIIGALDRFYSAPDASFTVGQMRLRPNAPSVVPGEAIFSLDLRHSDLVTLRRLGDTLRLICESERGSCDFRVVETSFDGPVTLSASVAAKVTAAADRLCLPHRPLVTRTGHDVRELSHVCPSGLILIPCRQGISHNEAEWAEPEHVAAGARVLTDTLWALAED